MPTMKNTRIIGLMLGFGILITDAYSQNKHDHTWILGNLPNDPAMQRGGTLLDFSAPTPQTSYYDLPAPTAGPYQAISDSAGNLLFYTNGCAMFNRKHHQMENGDGMNIGRVYERFCVEDYWGYPSTQGLVALPFPDSGHLYYAIYLSINEDNWWSDRLLFSVIDMKKDDGYGAVVQKHELVMRDTALQDALCAVRHANGRDWWIVAPRAVSPWGIFTVLLSPEGFSQPYFNSISPHLYDPNLGQSCFSPDGRKYCYNTGNFVYAIDFDRCAGTFSNVQYWRLPVDNSVPFTAGGGAVSPNSEYLYVATGAKVHQYELKAENIESTRVILTETQYPEATFKALTLAPDEKIYGIDFFYSNRLHVIQQPNEKGLACGFETHALDLPTYTERYLPYFPTYNLYDEPGSPCDTLCENNPLRGDPYSEAQIEINPNPARYELQFKLPFCPCGQWEIFDVAGRLIHAFPANSQDGPFYKVYVGHWPAGVYVIRGKTTTHQAFVKRFVVMR